MLFRSKKISGIDIKNMSEQQLRITLQNVSMHVHSRMKQIEKAGLQNISKSYQKIKSQFPDGISTKGKTEAEMRKALKAGVQYLNNQTGTVQGTRLWMRNVLNALESSEFEEQDSYSYDELKEAEEIFNDSILDDPDFWKLYRRTESSHKRLTSTDLLQEVYDEYELNGEELSISKMFNNLAETLKKPKEKKDLGLNVTSVESMTREI